MAALTSAESKLLKEVCSLPTAPFREELVQEFILFFAQERGLQAVTDKHGNIVIEYRPADASKTPSPVAFTAHMDHPGFLVTEFDETRSAGIAEVRGGIKAEHFPGQELLFYHRGQTVKAEAVSEFRKDDDDPFAFATIEIQTQNKALEVGDIGWYDVPFAQFSGDEFHTKSADDLAQVALLLMLLERLTSAEAEAHVYCIFTRAEEVGFVGAAGMLDSGLLPPEGVPLIVLECSKWLPGIAEIGGGPVLRVGDAATLYDPDVDLWMVGVARKLKDETKEKAEASNARRKPPVFEYQRALMTGGVCEAGLFARHRKRVGALALPLGNYHNVGEKGGAPEKISASDCANELLLMEAMATNPLEPDAPDALLERLQKRFDRLMPHLDGSDYASRKVT